MSGESLRVTIERAGWIATVVRTWRGAISSLASGVVGAQPSSTASRTASRKRLAGLNVAPRPRFGPPGAAGEVGSRAIERLYAHLAGRAHAGSRPSWASAYFGRD